MYKKIAIILMCVSVLCTGCAVSETGEQTDTVSETISLSESENSSEEAYVEADTEAESAETEAEETIAEVTASVIESTESETEETAVQTEETSAEETTESAVTYEGITEAEFNDLIARMDDLYVKYNNGKGIEADDTVTTENDMGVFYKVTNEDLATLSSLKAKYGEVYSTELVEKFFTFDSPSDMGLNTWYIEENGSLYVTESLYWSKDKDLVNYAFAQSFKVVDCVSADENTCVLTLESVADENRFNTTDSYDIEVVKDGDIWKVNKLSYTGLPDANVCYDHLYSSIHFEYNK